MDRVVKASGLLAGIVVLSTAFADTCGQPSWFARQCRIIADHAIWQIEFEAAKLDRLVVP